MKISKAIFIALIFMMSIIIGNENVFAATTVSNFQQLKAAITDASDGDTITVSSDINLTETLVIKNKNITLSGTGKISADNALKTVDDRQNTLFVIKDSKVTFDGLTLDGASKNRVIYSENSNITLTSTKIINGCPGNDSNINPGGGIFLQGGSLTATDTTFSNNKPGSTQGLKDGQGDKNGGAIYVGSTSADITINAGSFENNKVEVLGHGAAIYQNAGKLNIKGTKFKGNSGHYASDNEGTQGACIHTRENVVAEISDVEVEIAAGFNTGGFLRSYGSKIQVSGKSKFSINNLGDNYGVSGGVFCFEGGTSSVVGATFECKGNSKVSFAGGFIDIVGSGTHNIEGNTMTGRGNDNNSAIASFGGAISVEQGARATVTIKGNTITNSTASDNGGAIAIGTHKGVDTPSTVTMSGNKISNSGLIMWKGGAGGAVFVGKGSTVTVSGDEIKDTKAPYGGGIYNEGNLTINGGSTLTGGIALSLGGEIYNNGDLTIDDATITGNFVGGAWWNGNPHPSKPDEYGGVNIYAEKDVTITPKANIATGKDVRVLDGQSKILLTGALTKEIDVSVSEVAGGNETQKRRVGYVVAEGKDGYAATKSDANFLHYIGKNKKNEDQSLDMSHYTNQPRAAYDDQTSTGTWDFVLDKDNSKVVLGQRVKLIYHGNLGKIGTEDKKEKTVDVYKNPKFWENQLEEYKVADPTRDKHDFMGWYFWKDQAVGDTETSVQNITKPDDLKNDLFDFSKVTFQNNVKDTDKIITPNIINTYAGWSKNIDIDIVKAWVDTEEADKKDITVTLYDGENQVGDPKTFTKDNTNYGGKFENLPVFTKSYEGEEKNMNLMFAPKVYKVKEAAIAGFTTSYNPATITANADGAKKITITNSKTGNVFVKYITEDGTVLEAESKVVENAKVGTDYTTEQKSFDGYEFSKMADDSAASGKVVAGDLHVTYVYKAKTGNVFVKYITEDGTVLEAESKVVENAKVGTDYSTTQKTFKDYEFLKMADDSAAANGKVVAGDLHVVYVYKKTNPQPKTGSVYVKYIAEDGKVLEEESAVKTNAPVGETYTTEQKTFKGYEFSKIADGSAAANGVVAEGDLHVVYVYKANDKPNPPTTITTDYVDEQGTKLIPSKDGAQPKEDISGYEYLKTEKTKDKVTHIYKKIEKPTPQPPIIPEKPEFNPFWPIYFGSQEKYEVSEKVELNKEDHKAYMFGYPNWDFRPNSNMTRAEVTAMFARLLKNYPSTDVKYNLPYSDVFEGDWYYPAVGFMTENNIVKGYEDGTFRPNSPVTRAEFATIASKFEELIGDNVKGFADVPTTHWALRFINSAYARGWVTGYEDGTFRPNRNITRAEVVTVTNKMLIRYADKEFVRANKDILLHFKDLDESHWAYFNIMEATHGHDFTRKANMLDEIWHRLNGESFIFPDLKYNDR